MQGSTTTVHLAAKGELEGLSIDELVAAAIVPVPEANGSDSLESGSDQEPTGYSTSVAHPATPQPNSAEGLESVEELVELALDCGQPSAADERPALAKLWKLRTLEDAYQPRPPLQYAVFGLFALASLSIVFGAPGSLKSMILAYLAVCIAAGIPWLEPLDGQQCSAFRVTQNPVLWLDFDNGTRRTDERFEALGRSRNVAQDIPLYYVSMPTPWLDASDSEFVDDVAALVSFLKVRFVVIDNLGVINGGVGENDSIMAQVMGNLRRLAESTGAAVVIIHHQRKSSGGNARKGESLRGHSSIEAALDLALLVERDEGSDEIQLIPTKVRGHSVAPFGALFTFSQDPATKELKRARFFQLDVELARGDAAIDEAILAALQSRSPLNKGDLKKAVQDELEDVGVNKIGRRIDALAALGQIVQEDGRGTEKLYRLP